VHSVSAWLFSILVQKSARVSGIYPEFVSRLKLPAAGKKGELNGKKIPKNFFQGKNTVCEDFCERLPKRPGCTYPLFLWITLCIRVRKLSVNESGRGLRADWRETGLLWKVV